MPLQLQPLIFKNNCVQSLKSLSSLFNITVIAEYITFIAAIFLLRKKRTGLWRLFIVFLFVIVCTETSGWYEHIILKNYKNGWIFNINLLLTNTFLLWILSTAEPLQKARKKIFAVIILFMVAALINLLFFQGFWDYNQYSETAGDIILVIICCYLFYLLIAEEGYRNLFSYEYFWLANGILFSSLGSAILYIYPTLMGAYQKLTHVNVFAIINYVLNVLLYGSFIIAFICRNKNTK